MKESLTLLSLLIATSFCDVKACSCSNVPNTFDINIRVDHVIFLGTVLEQIAFKNDSGVFYQYHGLTKIKVDKWYQNQMASDTIYYANGQGAMCINSLEYLKVGEQVIIKAYHKRINELAFEVYSTLDQNFYKTVLGYKNKPIVGYGICDVSVLNINNNMVVGNITKNYQSRKLRQINFVKRISKRWAEKIKDKLRETKSIYQTWSLDDFARFMTAKWNSIIQ